MPDAEFQFAYRRKVAFVTDPLRPLTVNLRKPRFGEPDASERIPMVGDDPCTVVWFVKLVYVSSVGANVCVAAPTGPALDERPKTMAAATSASSPGRASRRRTRRGARLPAGGSPAGPK
jgi:hypothetical protein